MAQWITVYALLVMPMLWLAGLSMMKAPTDPSPYAQFVQSTQNLVVGVGELVVAGMLMAGGWRLRALKVAGPRILRAGLWTHLALGAVAIALEVWLLRLPRGPEAETAAVAPGELLVGLTGFGAIVFEVVALVWLRRNRHRLALVFAEAAPGSADALAEVAMTAPKSGVARHATLGAMLTAFSVVLGLAGIGDGAMAGVRLYQNGRGPGMGIGLGAIEIVIVLVGLLGVGGGGIAGAILGWGGLREVRESRGARGGVERALFAALAWPLIVVAIGMLVGLGWLFHRIGGGFWWMFWIALLGALASVELLVRATWRWVMGTPRGKRLGRLPGSGHGLVVGSVLAAVVTIFPPYSVGWTNYLRSQIPEMVATVRPSDGGPGPGDLQVVYPPRAIVQWDVEVYREGVLLAENRSAAHVVNGSVFESAHGPVRFSEEAGESGRWGGWKWEVGSDRGAVVFHASEKQGPGVRWLPAVATREMRVAVNEADEMTVLGGQGPDGAPWAVRLKARVSPLPPDYLFEGAIAGEGEDWEKTAARAVSMQSTKQDE